MLSVCAQMHPLFCEMFLDGVVVLSSVLPGDQIFPWSDQFGSQIVGVLKLLGPTEIELLAEAGP